jgi:hypothetical protein
MSGPQARRVVERWGLLAGVTGLLSNVLLVAVVVRPDWSWAPPAYSLLGGLATAALLPVALALHALLEHTTAMHVLTAVAMLAMALVVVLAVLLTLGVVPLHVHGPGAAAAAVVLFLWVGVVGRTATWDDSVPRELGRLAVTLSTAATVGGALVGLAYLLPRLSAVQYVAGGVGLILVAGAWLTFPVWLIRVSGSVRVPVAA